MKVSIVTPSYNSLHFLKDCHESIINQKEINFEHIVVDALSTDGTKEWCENKNITIISEKDDGMWDAVNKGISIASGDIILQLNCDEQLLQDSLKKAINFLSENKNIDFIISHMLVVDEQGNFNCFRKTFPLNKELIISQYLYAPTCATFYKKYIFDDFSFDSNFKDCADAKFVVNILDYGFKYKILNNYTSLFTLRKDNKQASANALKEVKDLRKKYQLDSNWYRRLKRYLLMLKSNAFFTTFPIKYRHYLDGTVSEKSVFFPSPFLKKIVD